MEKTNVFISYSHEDEIYKDKLEKYLTLLKRNNIIQTWNDRKIIAGEEWDKKIKNELDNSQIILLLISIDFLNSNYCYDVEIEKAIQKHEDGSAIVIPIILRKCDWQDTFLGKIQALPKNAKPIKSHEDEDEAFSSITDGIKAAIKQLNEKHKANKEEVFVRSSSIPLSYIKKLECDVPPNILHWIGRNRELEAIDSDLHKVVFISGIGGQGKSSLASHYIKGIAIKKDKWEFWDWRDCQEKENRIHTKVISIISRLTDNRIAANQISDEGIEDLIELFFQELDDRKIIFVFDNIDAYIEFENFQLIGAVHKLYKAALTKSHNSKFIFTCRSSINDIDIQLLPIKLQGLSHEDTVDLFVDYQLPFKREEVFTIASKSFSLTKGHPLWLNLIAAQAKRGIEVAESFIQNITPNSDFQENSLKSILSDKILRVIWESLNDKQKTLLKAFGAIVKAESQEKLSKILSSELNHNQFIKAFNALKQLNLIVVKSMIGEIDTFELHPLVKEYILQNFGKVERSKYISLFTSFYDSVILILKPRISSEQPLSFFENWTAKIELAVNNEDFKLALSTLDEISDPVREAGYKEEYIRVATLVYNFIDWELAISEEYSFFHVQFTDLIYSLTEIGSYKEAEFFLSKYSKNITGKGINYVRLCFTESYFLWFQNYFEEAIRISELGIDLESRTSTKSGLNLDYTLALSLRDTKIEENISKALTIFLKSNELSDLLKNDKAEFIDGETYGNVGRCLQYMGNITEAIICYKKSLLKLNDFMNKGYGFFWLAECMIEVKQLNNAVLFFKQAYNIWKKSSPIKSSKVNSKIEEILTIHPDLNFISSISERKIEDNCFNYLHRE